MVGCLVEGLETLVNGGKLKGIGSFNLTKLEVREDRLDL